MLGLNLNHFSKTDPCMAARRGTQATWAQSSSEWNWLKEWQSTNIYVPTYGCSSSFDGEHYHPDQTTETYTYFLSGVFFTKGSCISVIRHTDLVQIMFSLSTIVYQAQTQGLYSLSGKTS